MRDVAPAPPSPEGVRQVLVNGLALLLAYVLPRFFTVAAIVTAARVLGPEEFGIYGTAAAFAVLMSVVATLGMQPLLIREIARAPERAGELVRAAHVVKTGTNALMLGAVAATAFLLAGPDPRIRAAALVLAVGWALHAYAENLAGYFQAMERMETWTQASALYGLVTGVAGVGLLLGTGSLVAFCVGQATGWGAALVWLHRRSPPELRGMGRVRASDVRELVRGLLPFAAAFIGVTIYSKVDVLLLARWRGDVDVGVYTAAYKFVDVFHALVIVAAGSVYPRLSRAAPARRADFEAWRGGRSTEVVLLGAVPVGMGLFLLATPVTAILFGTAYDASAAAVRVLGLLLPLLAVSVHGGYVLGAAGRMLPVAAVYALGIGVNVALNARLAPQLGAPGAALSRLGSEALMAIAFLGVLRLAAGAAPRAAQLATAGAAVAVGVAVSLLPDPTGGWLRALVAAVAWVALYRVRGVLSAAELGTLREVLAAPGARRRRGVTP